MMFPKKTLKNCISFGDFRFPCLSTLRGVTNLSIHQPLNWAPNLCISSINALDCAKGINLSSSPCRMRVGNGKLLTWQQGLCKRNPKENRWFFIGFLASNRNGNNGWGSGITPWNHFTWNPCDDHDHCGEIIFQNPKSWGSPWMFSVTF